MLKKFLLILFLLGVLGLAAVGGYGLYLTVKIETRFAGQRWSIPSRVYSDVTLLYPGQEMSRSQVVERLRRLGYLAQEARPTSPGHFRQRGSSLEVYLRAVELPFLKRQALLVSLGFTGRTLSTIKRLDNNNSLALVELEPGELMQVFGTDRESRQLVSIKRVPKNLLRAVLAAEDADYYKHPGVDVAGILRALYVNLRAGEVRQGGSTITQQMAKNYFLTPERTLSRKLKELYISLLVELLYSKDEILEIYLNDIYFGQRGSVSVNGVGEAAFFYFGKSAKQLDLAECAALAAIIKGPNLYSPHKNPKKCQARRDMVLQSMHVRGWISKEQLTKAQAQQVVTAEYAPYVRYAPYYFDFLQSQLAELYSSSALQSMGLSIYTTLDAQVQAAAESALAKGLARLEKKKPKLLRTDPAQKLQGAIVVLQPKTGHVLALVGGRDYGQSQFNRITQAKRQPGSTFKPFVFLAGLEKHTLATELSNEARTYPVKGKPWTPRNYDGKSGGTVTMREALAHSMNLPTVDLAMRTGLDAVIATARDFELSTSLEERPSLALGAFEVVPLELARAYCALASDGVLPFPLSLRAVLDGQGEVEHRRHTKIKTVTSASRAFIIGSMLQTAVTEGSGKSLAAYGINFPVAGKTGTTSNYRDAWFIGATPELVALVWVGFDDGTSTRSSGSSAALPIWADLMKSIPWYHSRGPFPAPPGVNKATLCAESQKLAVTTCPETVSELFLEEKTPTDLCPIHSRQNALDRAVETIRNVIGF